ncbi:hypothetical protein SDC9_88693 [bioreactor metagenome]|uniref:CRISPR-associated exonuclease Cas4 n=1 Tax=bioreactor metagenome TaxID=1076179 RepID=A0A644ZQ74_9ZZZZ
MKEYDEDEYLLISGIQHFCFCRRQWALIHIENQWQENLKTVEGNIAHERCHDANLNEKRKDLLTSRGLRVFSKTMGVTGQCDVVEFVQADQGTIIFGRNGLWQVYPIEYKRGKEKIIDADRLQVCCQAMCLEEMFSCHIEKAGLFYCETHRREELEISMDLRTKTIAMLEEMHQYYKRGYTPKVRPNQGCRSCSLSEVCLPKLCKYPSVDSYYQNYLKGVDE